MKDSATQIKQDGKEGIDHATDRGSGGSEVLYQGAYKKDRPSINDDWIFKIPKSEINANPNITSTNQN